MPKYKYSPYTFHANFMDIVPILFMDIVLILFMPKYKYSPYTFHA